MFERLRAAIEAALDAAMPQEREAITSSMRDAVIEARAAIEAMREALTRTERLLARERQEFENAERRGRLASGIDDDETATVAASFAEKHGQRVEVLERKLHAQRDELALAEREYAEMRAELKRAEQDRVTGDAARSVDAAWRSLEAAGLGRPGTDPTDGPRAAEFDRAEREAQADAQLEELKRRMGRSD